MGNANHPNPRGLPSWLKNLFKVGLTKEDFQKSARNQNPTSRYVFKNLLLPLLSASEIILGWTISEIWIFCLFALQYGANVLAKKAVLIKGYLKTKFLLVIGTIKGNLWDQKSALVILLIFLRKVVCFEIFWVQVPKIDIWGIIPTQFSSLNINLLSKLENLNIWKFLKFPSSLKIWHQGDT